MKNYILILLTVFAFNAFGQEEELAVQSPTVREKINAARVAYITERLELTPEEAEKFWPVYREFVQKRQGLRKQFHQAKKNGQDEKALLDLDFKIKQQELDLEKEYSDRFLKIISPQKLMKLRGAESDFKKLILRQIEKRQGHRGGQGRRMQRDN